MQHIFKNMWNIQEYAHIQEYVQFYINMLFSNVLLFFVDFEIDYDDPLLFEDLEYLWSHSLRLAPSIVDPYVT